jgi:hypothetical protein
MTTLILSKVLRFNPNLWTVPTGWHIGHRDNKKLLVMNCLQFLLVVMIYMPPLDAPNNGKNLFRASLATLFRPDDFQFIHTGVNLVISHPVGRASIVENLAPWGFLSDIRLDHSQQVQHWKR